MLAAPLYLSSTTMETLTTLLSTLLTSSITLLAIAYCLYHYYTLPRHSIDIRAQWHGTVVGHRGCRLGKRQQLRLQSGSTASEEYNIPENSLASIVYALEHNCDAVEVDVQLTKDQRIVVMHDETLDRTVELPEGMSNVRCCDLTLAELQQLQYKSVGLLHYQCHHSQYQPLVSHARIPTLEQVIELCQQHNLKLMIELKESHQTSTMNVLVGKVFEQYNLHNSAFVADFNPLHLYRFRQLYPLVPTCLLYSRDTSQSYYRQRSTQMQPWAPVNTAFTRQCLDWLLANYSATLLTTLIGNCMIGPDHRMIDIELIDDVASQKVAVYTWVCNSGSEIDHLLDNMKEISVATDWIFERSQNNTKQRAAAAAATVPRPIALPSYMVPSQPATPSTRAKVATPTSTKYIAVLRDVTNHSTTDAQKSGLVSRKHHSRRYSMPSTFEMQLLSQFQQLPVVAAH